MITHTLLALAAVLLDWLLGEPRKWHPLVGFGQLASAIERQFNRQLNHQTGSPTLTRLLGVTALLVMLVPLTSIAFVLTRAAPFNSGISLSLIILYLTLGHRSLHDHARPVAVALNNHDDELARHLASQMVSRDSANLDITAATTESVLENGNDGVFGALFWFLVAGAPGALLYRLANTLDAMWGYRNARYTNFGWAAARFDDLMNYLPARLTALTYALLGKTRLSLSCWREQAPAWDSPNAGPVMAAGAGALGITLGGPACYQGEWHQRPELGAGSTPQVQSIEEALQLVRHGLLLWLGIMLVISAVAYA